MIIEGSRSMDRATELVLRYYSAFNRGDRDAMLACLADDVAHDINQGVRETGLEPYRTFVDALQRSHRLQLRELVVMANAEGTRAASEYMAHGEYVIDYPGMPPARGQRYVMPGGAFFSIRGDRIVRFTNYYNREDLLKQLAI
jgi:steroid delta-isomerase-like uncharacterized protein